MGRKEEYPTEEKRSIRQTRKLPKVNLNKFPSHPSRETRCFGDDTGSSSEPRDWALLRSCCGVWKAPGSAGLVAAPFLPAVPRCVRHCSPLKAKALLLLPPAGRALQGPCKLSLQLPGSREYLQVSHQVQSNPLLHQLHKSCRIFLLSFAIGVENYFNLIWVQKWRKKWSRAFMFDMSVEFN